MEKLPMGETFECTAPLSALPWTGERLTTDISGYLAIEYLHRYFFARSLCRGLDVLDVASGQGYGAALLAQVARSVVGIKFSEEAVAHSRAAYERPGLRFTQGDARRIQLPGDSVDVVVSFETIEHCCEHDEFVAEVRRVLRPGGLFIVSSPERDMYSLADRSPDPCRVRELTRAEFKTRLAGTFPHVTMYAQRPMLGAALMAEAPPAGTGPLLTFERRDARLFESSVGLARPIYLVAVASDAPFVGSIGSLYVETSGIEAISTSIRTAEEQAEDWRRRLIESNEDYAALQHALETLEAKYGEERQRLVQSQADLQQAHDAMTTRHAAMLDEWRALLWKHEQVQARAAGSERQLHAVLSSTSWRLTGPLRGIASRNPALVRGIRGFFSRHSGMQRLALHSARGAWRAMTLRPINSEPTPVIAAEPMLSGPAPASQPAHPVADLALDPTLWFFVGDTIEWLQAHEQVTGVGRVVVELFFASLDRENEHQAVPCVLGNAGRDLVSVSRLETVYYLASRVGTHTVSDLLNAADEPVPAPLSPSSPGFGDHVVFTGVVWTPAYEDLFRSLSENGIGFSVLIYDIIPIEQPGLVGERYHETFRDWLETTVTLASVIFVSSAVIKDQILRWAILSGIDVAATIIPIKFGCRDIKNALSCDDLKANAATSRIELESFVLSVGTIDNRKNQALLCRLWGRLVSDLGDSRVPQLALVGRDDLKIADLDEGVASLVKASKIVVLEGLPDAALAGLYRACLFTAFPSLSEGYGLPVAESFQHGKLCISSDLAVIREHAGDLPWYFDPADETAAYDLLRHAIEDLEARTAAERRIARLYSPCTWASAYRTISETAYERSGGRTASSRAPIKPYRPVISGVPAAALPTTLARSQKWCTDVDPDVSILIINWNAGQLTRECVTQIWANTDGVRYEIIIADNGSDPQDIMPLRMLGRGVRLLALGMNRFLGEANNIAAERASGRYICLLNNDAFVQPGWLRSLVDDLEHTPEAGAVGPLFLFPDNTIQEAVGAINEAGYPVRFGRGHRAEDAEFLVPQFVDYVSAATLLLPRELFMAVGGFDLAYEPAYYEDVDLCFKIRALGRKVHYCPAAKVIHIQGSAANDNPVVEARRKALGDLNRDKFTSRWGAYLKSRSAADLERVSRRLRCYEASGAEGHACAEAGRKAAAVFTPFPLTPGGGERYLLTLASALTADYVVTIVTPHPYSYLRLLSLGREFSVDLSACKLLIEEEFLLSPRPDFMVTMGNHIVPPIAARATSSIYICQFPFPMPTEAIRDTKQLLAEYRSIIAYSEYAKGHILEWLSALQQPTRPVEVIYPPVPLIGGDADRKKAMILSVGRFFVGDHSKRHDVMILTFRALIERSDADIELHLAGSSVPIPEHMDYLNRLREMAKGLPVVFHVNAPSEELFGLYRDAAVYWHATGLEADLDRRPEEAEHFGISIVEAMSAECVPLAFNAGGPRELITHGVNGFLFGSREELTETTRQLFEREFLIQRRAVGRAAGQRAAAFSLSNFICKVRNMVHFLQ